MSMDDVELEALRSTFLVEALELMQVVHESLLKLAAAPKEHATIHVLFRAAHSLKGSAGAVLFTDFAAYVHHIEDLLAKLAREDLQVSQDMLDVLLNASDVMDTALQALRSGKKGAIDPRTIALDLARFHAPTQSVSPQNGWALFDDGPLKPDAAVPPAASTALQAGLGTVATEYVQLPLAKIETILNFFGEQVILQSILENVAKDLVLNQDLAKRTIVQMSKLTRILQDTVMSLRMVPIKPLYLKMQRIVRDTARQLGKDVRIECLGEELELDKKMVDNLLAPVTHLIRNSLDHGIEVGPARTAAGKPATATIILRASYESGSFLLEITDDGRGLDRDKILKKAVAVGLLGADDQPSDDEIYRCIFHPGLSTKEQVTELSGRGYGMDIVRSEVTKMQGTITLSSKAGQGTKIAIRLPMTVAIFNALVVRVGDQRCVIPNADVRQIFQTSGKTVVSVEHGARVVQLEDRVLPVLDVLTLAKLPPSVNQPRAPKVFMEVESRERVYALLVDDIVSQQRVVMKSLGREIKNCPAISGGAILADGTVAFVLETSRLCDEYLNTQAS